MTITVLPVTKTKRQPGFHAIGTRPIRWKRSRLWQARLWIGTENGGDVSLGLHRSERAAHQFWFEVRRLMRTRTEFDHDPIALAVWECCRIAFAANSREWKQLPKWVREVEDGGQRRYVASGTIRGTVIETEAHDEPRDAFLSFWEVAGPKLRRRQLAFV